MNAFAKGVYYRFEVVPSGEDLEEQDNFEERRFMLSKTSKNRNNEKGCTRNGCSPSLLGIYIFLLLYYTHGLHLRAIIKANYIDTCWLSLQVERGCIAADVLYIQDSACKVY